MIRQIIKSAFLIGITFFLISGCKQESKAKMLNSLSLSYLGSNVDSLTLLAINGLKVSTTRSDELTSRTLLAIAAFKRQKFDSGYYLMQNLLQPLIDVKNFEFAAYASSYIGTYYFFKDETDSIIKYHKSSIEFLKNVDNDPLLSDNYGTLAQAYNTLGKLDESVRMYLKCLELVKDDRRKSQVLSGLSSVYLKLNQPEKALKYALESKGYAETQASKYFLSMSLGSVVEAYSALNEHDSALHYGKIVIDLLEKVPSHRAYYYNLAGVQAYSLKNYEESLELLWKASAYQDILESNHNTNFLLNMSNTHSALGNIDSAIHYANKSALINRAKNAKSRLLPAVELLAKSYAAKDALDSSYKYLREAKAIEGELFDQKMIEQFSELNIEIETLAKEKELQAALVDKVRSEDQQIIVIISSISILCILAMVFWRHRQQANLKSELLEVEKRSLSLELEKSKQLLSTQTLNMIHKNNGFSEIVENLKGVNGTGIKIKKIIDINMALEKDWENFNEYFSHVHGDFYTKLKNRHPDLSITETRLCSMVKMGLKNKEMATILNIEYSSITMAKYRLKKKFVLAEDDDVGSYINSL